MGGRFFLTVSSTSSAAWGGHKKASGLGMDDTDGNEIHVQLLCFDVQCKIIWVDHGRCAFWHSGILASWTYLSSVTVDTM